MKKTVQFICTSIPLMARNVSSQVPRIAMVVRLVSIKPESINLPVGTAAFDCSPHTLTEQPEMLHQSFVYAHVGSSVGTLSRLDSIP